MIQIMEDCRKVSDNVWREYAMRRDVLYSKTTWEQRQELGEKAEICGRELAQKIKAELKQKGIPVEDARAVAKEKGMEVRDADPFAMEGYYLFAEFEEPNLVYLHQKTIAPAVELQEQEEAFQFLYTPLENHLLYHEMFHFFESKMPSLFTQTEKITIQKFGPFHRESTLLSLGEIAGMKFVEEMLDLDYSPFLLDIFFLYPRDQKAATALYEEIMEIQKKFELE